MSMRRLALYVASAIVAAVVGYVSILSYSAQAPPMFENTPKLVAAIQAFVRDRSKGETLPSTVTLRELIGAGYLSAEDVRAFAGMDVAFSLKADETRPNDILVAIRMPDGTVNVGLVDGSVAQVTERAYRRQFDQPGPGAGADGSRAIARTTNAGSSAPGSRRSP